MTKSNEIKKILIVDDSATIRAVEHGYVEKMGYRVFECESGEKALEFLASHDVDLVILDVEMEGMNGFETSNEITKLSLEKNISIPVVILTSNDTMEYRLKGLESGVSEYLTKPVSYLELEHTVNGILKPRNDLEGVRVLLVDDSETTRMILRQHLSRHGVFVEEAAGGLEAIETMKRYNYAFDVIVLDIYMPDMDGFEVCKYIRSKTVLKKIPVLFLSAASNSDDILKVYNIGGSDYINKPFIKDELLAKIRVHSNSYKHEMAMNQILQEQKKIDTMKDDFLSVCSHDLRSPMSGILGLTGLLLEDDSIGGEQKESLRYIRSTGEDIMGMIEDLLVVTNPLHLNHLELKPTLLNELLKKLSELYDMSSRLKGIDYSFEAPDEDVMVRGNEGALSRVFGNLLSNAVKFTRAGGEINVRLSKKENGAVVEIRDTGQGMSREQMTGLFQKFRTFGEGTIGEKSSGLGLYIVRTFVRAHNATVSVKSAPGKGSSFYVKFPLL